MCLVSSATYLVNDVRDVAQDRLHPRKRSRPDRRRRTVDRRRHVAAAALALAGIALGVAITPGLGVLACGYLALTACYSLWLRRIVILDMLAIQPASSCALWRAASPATSTSRATS